MAAAAAAASAASLRRSRMLLLMSSKVACTRSATSLMRLDSWTYCGV
jgi:hypothetical protein